MEEHGPFGYMRGEVSAIIRPSALLANLKSAPYRCDPPTGYQLQALSITLKRSRHGIAVVGLVRKIKVALAAELCGRTGRVVDAGLEIGGIGPSEE